MRRFAIILLVLSVFLTIGISVRAQSTGNNSVMLTVGMVPWISGIGAEYQYRYNNWGFGADLLLGRNAGSVRGFSSHAIVKWHYPLIEGLSVFAGIGAGVLYTWNEFGPDYLYFNPHISAGFEGRYKWLVSSIEVGYGPGIGEYVIHSTYLKFGVGVSF